MPNLHDYDLVTVPGLRGSGPEHWQSRWERNHPGFRRVVQENWDVPDLDAWSKRVDAETRAKGSPILIVAHSFGCLASVYAASRRHAGIAGALLVAPADPEKFGIVDRLLARELAFPSILIASANDPWMKAERAAFWAKEWGSAFIDAGELGHINAESNLGDWAFGWHQLQRLARIGAMAARFPMASPSRQGLADAL